MTAEPLRMNASSHLAAARYDHEAQVLEIDFQDGQTYAYSGVPSQVALGLEHAPSPGSYFHRWIRQRYPYA